LLILGEASFGRQISDPDHDWNTPPLRLEDPGANSGYLGQEKVVREQQAPENASNTVNI
jgi:hypothetical protein